MPQIITLCGIQPEQTDIDLQNHGLDAADAKLLAFDLSKNRTVRTLKCAASAKRLLLCQRPLTRLYTLSPFPTLPLARSLGANNIRAEGATALAAILNETRITSLKCAAP